MKLWFSEFATAGVAFSVGLIARAAGFKLLDKAKPCEFDTALFADKNPPVPHSPLRYASMLTGSCVIIGAYIGTIGAQECGAKIEQEQEAALIGMLMGATAGVFFSVGAKVSECRNGRANDEVNLAQLRETQAFLHWKNTMGGVRKSVGETSDLARQRSSPALLV